MGADNAVRPRSLQIPHAQFALQIPHFQSFKRYDTSLHRTVVMPNIIKRTLIFHLWGGPRNQLANNCYDTGSYSAVTASRLSVYYVRSCTIALLFIESPFCQHMKLSIQIQ